MKKQLPFKDLTNKEKENSTKRFKEEDFEFVAYQSESECSTFLEEHFLYSENTEVLFKDVTLETIDFV